MQRKGGLATMAANQRRFWARMDAGLPALPEVQVSLYVPAAATNVTEELAPPHPAVLRDALRPLS
jgi:hypothetical protein